MNIRGRKFDTRSILIVLFVIVVIAAIYILITNLPEEEDFLTPEEVLNNKDIYLNGETIVIKGYFIYDGDYPAVVSNLATTTGRPVLRLDYSDVENADDILKTEDTFKFTGILIIDEADPLGLAVKFMVEKIEKF